MDFGQNLVDILPSCTPETQAEISYQIVHDEYVAAQKVAERREFYQRIELLWLKTWDAIETIATTGLTIFTAVVLLNPALNAKTTAWFQGIDWLHEAQKVASETAKGVGQVLTGQPEVKPDIASLLKNPKTLKVGDTVAGYPVTSGFGPRTAPCEGCSSEHQGVDVGTPFGTPLKAVGVPGEKVTAVCNPDDGMGKQWIQLTSPSIPGSIEYLHLSECSPGTYNPGDVVAKSGDAGTGPHLHAQYRTSQGKVNPPAWMVEAAITGKLPLPEQPKVAQADQSSKQLNAMKTAPEQAVFKIQNGSEIGTGFILYNNLAITNRHVVQSSKQVQVILADGRNLTAQVIAVSQGNANQGDDLALLQLPEGNYPYLRQSMAQATVGQDVQLIGYPFGKFAKANAKIQGTKGDTFWRIDPVAKPGNSGGPLINNQGWVGLVSAVGPNDAIAINQAKIRQFLKANGY